MSMINCRIQHFTLVMMPNSMSLCVCVCLNLCPFPHIHIENYMMRKLTLKDTLFFKEKNIINGIKFSLFSNNAVHQHLNIYFFLMAVYHTNALQSIAKNNYHSHTKNALLHFNLLLKGCFCPSKSGLSHIFLHIILSQYFQIF